MRARILESPNFPYIMSETPYEYGEKHGIQDRGEKQKYRPEIHLTEEELKEYKKGYRHGYAKRK